MRPMELAGEVARRAAIPAMAVVLGVGGVACNSDGETALRATGPTISAQNGKEAANACAGDYDLTANLADDVFADRASIFPALENKEGELLPTPKASELMQKQTGSDFRVAAVMSEVYNIRDNRQAPDTLTVPGFESAVDTMKKNNNSVAKRVEYICNQLSFVEPNESGFAVVGGNATEISFMRGEEGVVGIVFQTITTDRVLSGFNLSANFDDNKLKREDREFLEQFERDVLVTEDGKIVIRNLALNGGIDVSEEVAETPVSPTPDENSTQTGGGAGQFGEELDTGESDRPGSVPERGGDGGHTPGEQPSYGPGTSTTTRGNVPSTTTSTIPGSTSTTTSSTTRPPVVTTTTTIPTPKGTVPKCEPNPPYVYC